LQKYEFIGVAVTLLICSWQAWIVYAWYYNYLNL